MRTWSPARARLVAVVCLTAAAGCEDLAGRILPTGVGVSLVNDSAFDVRVELYVGDQQEVPEFVLTEFGERLEFTVAAGDAVSFSRGCDELQAMVIDRAELRVVGDIGPETSTAVLRDGTDYACGERIVFTFDHGPILLDFRVTTEVR